MARSDRLDQVACPAAFRRIDRVVHFSQTADGNGNLIGSAAGAGVIDAGLSPLANNGGSTQTHALSLTSKAFDAGDNGIEADNREGDENAQPRSLPRIANMTITGNPDERGIRLRRGTGLKLYNSVVQNSAKCLRVQGESLNQLGTGITALLF